jgi:hypothetical protein
LQSKWRATAGKKSKIILRVHVEKSGAYALAVASNQDGEPWDSYFSQAIPLW